MENFRELLKGKKTYLAVIIGGLYLLGVWAGAWEYSETVLGALGLSGLAFLRAAMPKAKPPVVIVEPAPTQPTEPRINGTALLPLSLLLAGLMFTGCVTNPAGRALVTTVDTVDAAMKGWAQYVEAGQATAADELIVQDAYAKYQLAMTAARKAYAAAYKAGDTSLFTSAAEALKGSRTELLALIQKLQVKPKPQARVWSEPMPYVTPGENGETYAVPQWQVLPTLPTITSPGTFTLENRMYPGFTPGKAVQ